MHDLNDLRYFAAVVEHGGFAPAGRALKIPKSKLSRRVAGLEERLGVRLLERSTRRFRVTDVGEEFHRHCAAMLAEAEAAEDVIARRRSAPRGLVRMSCPTSFVGGPLAAVLPGFLAAHPQIRVQVLATNRRIDLIDERVDLALRVRSRLEGDAALIRRVLGYSRGLLVAAPGFFDRPLPAMPPRAPQRPEELPLYPTLAHSEEEGPATWLLTPAAGQGQSDRGQSDQGPEEAAAEPATLRVDHDPRLSSSDFDLLHQAACGGLGIALLPDSVCERSLRSGKLVPVLPGWHGGEATAHLVYTARRGLLPAVRALIDHLVATFPPTLRDCREAGGSSESAEAAFEAPAVTPPA